MSISVNTSTETAVAVAQTQATQKIAQQSTAKTTSTTSAPNDEVKISATAQAKQLHMSGQSVKQISAALGMDTKSVEELLGLTTDVTTAVLAAATAGAGGGA